MPGNVYVHNDRCVGCGECVGICPVKVFEMVDSKSVTVNAEECLGCEACVEVCATDAIVVE